MKDVNINIRCTEEQKAQIKRDAESHGLTVSAYIISTMLFCKEVTAHDASNA